MQRIDANGAVWQVVSVDMSIIAPELIEAVDASIAEWDVDSEIAEGSIVDASLLVGVGLSCTDPSGADDAWNEDAESRSRKTAPFTDRQTSVVRIVRQTYDTQQLLVLSEICSGTLLLDRWVLTSQHCIKNGTTPVGVPSEYVVRSVFNEEIVVGDFHLPGGYTGLGDWDTDWILMHLSAPFPTDTDDMDLFSGADSVFEGIGDRVHNLSYPSATLPGTSNFHTCDVNDGGSYPDMRELFHQSNSDVTSSPSGLVKLKSDASTAASGSSYYFFPDGNLLACEPGEKGEIISLCAGMIVTPTSQRVVGPKASDFRATAIIMIQSGT